MKERQLWIDLLKGFGIILVTFAHLSPNYLLEKQIYSFHMCLFFFISGYLFKDGQNKKSYIIKKIKNLLIPFLIWNLICSGIELLIRHDVVAFFHKLFIIDGDLCWNAPIWFLLILFATEIIFLFLQNVKIFNNKYIHHILIFILSLLIFILIGSNKMILKINLIPLGLLFFNFGYIYKLIKDSIINKNNKIIIFLLCIILLIINVIFSVILNDRVSYTRAYFGNILYFIISSISGVLGYFMLFEQFANKLKRLNFLANIGFSSMTIMIFQYPLFYIYKFISIKLLNGDIWHYRSTLKALILCMITVSFILLVKCFIKKIINNKKGKEILKYMGIV